MSRTPSSPKSASALSAHWHTLAPREQHLLRAAVVLIALALLWWLALAPALQTLRSAPARHAALDAQLQQMHTLQAEAEALKNAPRADPDNALRALQASVTERLGPSARLGLSGDRATLTIKNTAADALALWLVQARSNGKAAAQEAHWTRSSATADPAAHPSAQWNGTLVLALPAR
jgi:general secretion pathway protein M